MNAIVKIYGGLFDSIELFASEEQARKRYKEILSKKDTDYNIWLKTNLKLQDVSQATCLLDEALKGVQEFSYKDWDASRVERLIMNLKKVLK